MTRAIETRLRKLEKATASTDRRTFVFGEVEAGKAKKAELIASGIAREEDVFIFTGVPRGDRAYAVWGGSE